MLCNPDAPLSEKAAAVRNRETRALSRAISDIENGDAAVAGLMKELYPYTGGARVIGFTGAPGAGKSSLIHELILEYLRDGLRVAVIAVDPTSEFTGGGVLGDRVRMPVFSDDLFIRSFGARGRLGGLSDACGQTVALLDAAGFDRIVVETVGAGQSEIEIRYFADIVVVVTNPNQGDDIQMLKAGVLEIGDVFLVNKCELPGADRSAAELVRMTHLNAGTDDKVPIPPVIQVSIREKIGLQEMVNAIEGRIRELEQRALLEKRRRQRIEREMSLVLARLWKDQVLSPFQSSDLWKDCCEQVNAGEVDPQTAGERLWDAMKNGVQNA